MSWIAPSPLDIAFDSLGYAAELYSVGHGMATIVDGNDDPKYSVPELKRAAVVYVRELLAKSLDGVGIEVALDGMAALGLLDGLLPDAINHSIVDDGKCIGCGGPLVSCTCRPDCPGGMCGDGGCLD